MAKNKIYTIAITSQYINLTDHASDKDKIIKTADFISSLTTINALFSTDLIDPGLKYLSADYIVDNHICCDIAYELLPSRFEGILTPWITLFFTVSAPLNDASKVSLRNNSVRIYISEHQIYNLLTEVHVPTFLTGVSEVGVVDSDEFYEEFNNYQVYTPFSFSELRIILEEAFRKHISIDVEHPDFVKLKEVALAQGYDPTWTPSQANEKKFLFDFSFLPSFEFDTVLQSFGRNTMNRIYPPSLYHMFDY